MNDVWTIIARGLCGGLLVLAFAVIGEAVQPKRFAGIFAAAPAVALAGMAVTLLTSGSEKVANASLGMIGGSLALVAFCVCAIPLVRCTGAVAGSALALVVWVAVAGAAAGAGWLIAEAVA